MNRWTDKCPRSNMPLQLLRSWGHKDLLPDVTFCSFSGQETAGNKLDLVPFPLPVFGEVLLFLLVITGRKTDSLIRTDEREGADLNGLLKPSRTIERTHLLCVNSPHCSTKWANLPPTGISGRGKIGSGKGWLSELCGRQRMFRGGELFSVTSPLRKVLPSTGHKGLSLSFRPVRLALFRSGRLARLSRSLECS